MTTTGVVKPYQKTLLFVVVHSPSQTILFNYCKSIFESQSILLKKKDTIGLTFVFVVLKSLHSFQQNLFIIEKNTRQLVLFGVKIIAVETTIIFH